jgi:hypothetical protein
MNRDLSAARGTRAVATAAVLLTLLAGWAGPVAAQAVYGSVAGAVTDPQGAALPGVTVTFKSVERGTVDSVVTNESGSRSACCPAYTR